MLQGFHHVPGRYAESSALTQAMAFLGVTSDATGKPFTEAMVFGAAGGVGLEHFVFDGHGGKPVYIGTRAFGAEAKEPAFLGRACKALCVPFVVKSSSSESGADKALRRALDEQRPPLVWLNRMVLPYLGDLPGHPLAYHCALALDLDEEGTLTVAERAARPCRLSRLERERARATNSMTPKRRLVVVDRPGGALDAAAAAREGITTHVALMTTSPYPHYAASFGLAGFETWARLLVDRTDPRGWARLFAKPAELVHAAVSVAQQVIARGGGGDGLRGMFADFLKEAAPLLDDERVAEAARLHRASSKLWRQVPAALLPDDVAPLCAVREAMVERTAVFEERGDGARAKVAALNVRIAEQLDLVKRAAPFDQAVMARVREAVAELVQKIHAAEAAATTLLAAAVQEGT